MLVGAVCAGVFVGGCTGSSPFPSLDGRVVDEVEPAFSNPTEFTNPLFPAGTAQQIVQLGVDRGQPLRVEITLMPETRTVEWDGRSVETVVSQFISYRDGRILEVAYDFFAQADDGSVWYLGEEVDNYSDGSVSDHGGAWLAGEDGPAGMIMPNEPDVGDVFHPENIPGVVFEEVIVLETDLAIDGPTGEINGAIRVREHLMEGNAEEKVFAPGYGEFLIDAPGEMVTVALAVPTDSVAEPPAPALGSIPDTTREIFDAATSDEWGTVTDGLASVRDAWAMVETGETPTILAERMTTDLDALAAAIDARDQDAVRRSAVDVGFAALDVALQHGDPAVIDLGRMAMWSRRLLADVGDDGAARGDVATLETIWDRTRHAVGSADADAVVAELSTLRAAMDAADADDARTAVDELVPLLDRLTGDAG